MMDRIHVSPVRGDHPDKGLLLVGQSDVGRGGREENQDFMNVFEAGDSVLAVVADGMGGHSGGFEASRIAVHALGSMFQHNAMERDPRAMLDEGIRQAHENILQVVAARPDLQGMGTTVVAVLVRSGAAWIAHVGDSRCYLIREGQPTLLTLDHSRINRMVVEGMIRAEEAAAHPMSSVLERSVGASPVCEPEVRIEPVKLRRGDRLLLCSDGLWSAVDDTAMAQLASVVPVDAAAQALLQRALDNQTDDNATLVLVHSDVGDSAFREEDVRVRVGLMTAPAPRAAPPPLPGELPTRVPEPVHPPEVRAREVRPVEPREREEVPPIDRRQKTAGSSSHNVKLMATIAVILLVIVGLSWVFYEFGMERRGKAAHSDEPAPAQEERSAEEQPPFDGADEGEADAASKAPDGKKTPPGSSEAKVGPPVGAAPMTPGVTTGGLDDPPAENEPPTSGDPAGSSVEVKATVPAESPTKADLERYLRHCGVEEKKTDDCRCRPHSEVVNGICSCKGGSEYKNDKCECPRGQEWGPEGKHCRPKAQ